ncbi:MAG: Rab family GTPase [Promethearchaeota archaeon]
MSAEPTYKFKINLFGPTGVGKTSLLIRFVENYFNPDLKKSIGSNFLVKDINIEDKHVRLIIWDIAGDQQFAKLRSIYFQGSNGTIGVYDVTDKQSLLKLPGWISSIKKAVKKAIPMLLIGNKVDLERQVSKTEAEDMASRLSCTYLETSAKTGKNVEDAFKKLAMLCLESILK